MASLSLPLTGSGGGPSALTTIQILSTVFATQPGTNLLPTTASTLILSSVSVPNLSSTLSSASTSIPNSASVPNLSSTLSSASTSIPGSASVASFPSTLSSASTSVPSSLSVASLPSTLSSALAAILSSESVSSLPSTLSSASAAILSSDSGANPPSTLPATSIQTQIQEPQTSQSIAKPSSTASPSQFSQIPSGDLRSTSSLPLSATESIRRISSPQLTYSTSADFRASPFVISASGTNPAITIPPQTAVQTGVFTTSTLSVTGSPGSFSVTTTTDKDGHPTILPIFFGNNGLGQILFPLSGDILGGKPPSPPGFPQLDIGPDGKPTPEANLPDNAQPTGPQVSISGTKSRLSTEMSSTSQSTTSTTSSSTTPSSTATAGPTSGVIYRSDSATDQQAALFGDTIENSGAGEVKPMLGATGPLAWHGSNYNASIVDELKKNSVFGEIVYDTQSEEDITDNVPDTGLTSRSNVDMRVDKRKNHRLESRGQCCGRPARTEKQSPAPFHLSIISTEPGKIPADEYVYDPNAGDAADVTIYIIESGIQADHPIVQKYEKLTGKQVRILSGSYQGKVGDVDPTNHGTCVWAYAVSGDLGVAKKASVVVVTFDTVPGNDKRAESNSWNNALSLAVEDVRKKNAGHRSIINLSSSVGGTQNPGFAARVRLLAELEQLGALVVMSAGNDGENAAPDNLIRKSKQLWLRDNQGNERFENILLVGATEDNGQRWAGTSYSPGDDPSNPTDPYIHVWAHGTKLQCPGVKNRDLMTAAINDGTSLAAPQVAGLAATLMASANPPKSLHDLKATIIALSYSRSPGNPRIIYNGIHDPCFDINDNNNKRDTGNDTACTQASDVPSTFLTVTTAIDSTVQGTSSDITTSAATSVKDSSTEPVSTSTPPTTTTASSPSTTTTTTARITNFDQFDQTAIDAEISAANNAVDQAINSVDASISSAAAANPTPTCNSQKPKSQLDPNSAFAAGMDDAVGKSFKAFCDTRGNYGKLKDAHCDGDLCTWHAHFYDVVFPSQNGNGGSAYDYAYDIFRQGDKSRWPNECEALLNETVTCDGAGKRYGGTISFDAGYIGWVPLSMTLATGVDTDHLG